MSCSNNMSMRISASSEEYLQHSDKSDPYISKKNVVDIASLNISVKVSDEHLVCRDLSALYISESINHHNNGKKFRVHELFGSKESIRRVAPSNVHDLYDLMLNKSCDRRIIVCDRLGDFLHEISTNTKANNQRLFLLLSCSHVMALKVTCKLKTNEFGGRFCSYVVHLFDPNRTNVVARSEVSDPKQFLDREKFSLRRFVGSSSYREYFEYSPDAPTENEIMVCEYSDSDVNCGGESLSRLETLVHDGISECALHHLMESGVCSESIVMMSEKLPLLPPDVRENIVYGRNSGGVTSLCVALTSNHYNSVRAYCYFLSKLSDDEKLRLLPRLLVSSNLDRALSIGLDQGLDLDLDIDINELPVLLVAMQEGNADSVYAFADFLDILLSLRGKVPASELATIIFGMILAASGAGDTALYVAMEGGCSDEVFAFGALLDRLALVGRSIPRGDIEQMMFDVLLAKSSGFGRGLFKAFVNNDLSVIKAFCSLLSRINKCKWPELLAAKDGNGIPGMLFANEGTVGFYLNVLSDFDVGVLSGLLSILENSKERTNEYRMSINCLYIAQRVNYANFLSGLERIINSRYATSVLLPVTVKNYEFEKNYAFDGVLAFIMCCLVAILFAYYILCISTRHILH